MNAYTKSADSYLAQRVLNAGPEQQAALLMEAGQLFIGRAIKAMEVGDHTESARCFRRVTDIINEAFCRLNHEDGGELVENLVKMYDWWTREVLEASREKDSARLKAVSQQMGEIRQAWEQYHEKLLKAQGVEAPLGDQVV